MALGNSGFVRRAVNAEMYARLRFRGVRAFTFQPFFDGNGRFRQFGDACNGTRHFWTIEAVFTWAQPAEWALEKLASSAVKSSLNCTHTCVFAELGLSRFYPFGGPMPRKPFMALTIRPFDNRCIRNTPFEVDRGGFLLGHAAEWPLEF
jgi:hypothetical protein